MRTVLFISALACFLVGCQEKNPELNLELYQTSAAGDQLTQKEAYTGDTEFQVELFPDSTFQTITGFGGAFTESSTHLLLKMPDSSRQQILERYFGSDGNAYSLCRTHINSCDFSLDNYAYVAEGDSALETFSVDEDRKDIIPVIKQAQEISQDGFKIVASPWTAPPWMKNNNQWEGGSLLPKYYQTWAEYFSKYIEAYQQEGIDIWAVTVENEPLGNGANWESMHYTPEEMAHFVKNNLSPQLQETHPGTKILVYDQNKGEELEEWAGELLTDTALLPHIYGTAVHWYTGTKDWFPESLQYTHELAPDKHIIHTEGCVDAEVPKWKNDEWYWKEEATDWGYEWALPENRDDHPKYVPVYRYARDIIGSLNNWEEGWIDWNMVLDKQGGPNWAENWCIAPVIVDTVSEETYYTPLFYTLGHFSRFIKPGDQRIGFHYPEQDSLMLTATQNIEDEITLSVLNMSAEPRAFSVKVRGESYPVAIDPQAVLSVILK